LANQHLGGPVQLPEQLARTFAHHPPPIREFVGATSPVDRPITDYLETSDAGPPGDFPADDKYRLLFAMYERFGAAVSRSGGKLFIGFIDRNPRGLPLARYAHQLGIGSLDLFSYIDDHRRRSAHLSKDGHWNEHGHALVGKAM